MSKHGKGPLRRRVFGEIQLSVKEHPTLDPRTGRPYESIEIRSGTMFIEMDFETALSFASTMQILVENARAQVHPWHLGLNVEDRVEESGE